IRTHSARVASACLAPRFVKNKNEVRNKSGVRYPSRFMEARRDGGDGVRRPPYLRRYIHGFSTTYKIELSDMLSVMLYVNAPPPPANLPCAHPPFHPPRGKTSQAPADEPDKA